MLKLLKIVRDAGEVTIKYPFAPAEFTPTFRGKPEYDPKRCIACAACAIACPPNALTMQADGVTEEDPDQRRQFETCPQCKRKQTLGLKPRQEV